MSRIVVAVILLSKACHLLAQSTQEYCAFEVAVSSPKGRPIYGATVSVVDQQTHVYGTAMTNGEGVARLCDSPRGLINIQVGGQLCGSIVVRNLKAYWRRTRRIVVIYDC